MRPRMILVAALLIGLGTMLIDLAFHFLLTSPMETPAYFLAKFLLAFIVAVPAIIFLRGLRGALIGGIVFDALTGVYYYVAYFTRSTVLSCCYLSPPAVHGLMNQTFGYLGGYPISSDLLTFAVVHFGAFFTSYLIVRRFCL